MEPTLLANLEAAVHAPTSVEDFRTDIIERFAACLMGELERGARVAHYRAPRMLVGIDLVVNYNLDDLSKQVEYALKSIATAHIQRRLRLDYKVTLNTVNGQLRFTAYMRPA